jgi:hypothetical protein
MQSEVQLIVGESKFLVNASAQSSGIGGCLGIRVFEDISAYIGNELIYTDAIYGTVKQPYTVFTPWNGTFMILELTGSCITYSFSAMGTVSIYNNTQSYLDLFENESISQNWKFQDLNNFTSQGAFSREFRVPFSENNQKALGALFDVNVDAGSNNYFHYKLPAEIRVDTLPIATGYVRVRKVYKTMNRISEVELAFYAETPDLVRNIGEKKLSEIADLPSLNEEVSYANVTTSNADRVWTILDRGQLWSENGEANTRSLQDPNTPVYPADLTPALNWWYLFNQIITDAGFDLVAGSLQNILETYYMPWCNSRFLQGSDTTGEFGFKAETNASFVTNGYIPFNTEIYDNLSDFDPTTFTYTAPASGIYTFNLNLLVGLTGASARVFIQAVVNVSNVENVIDTNFFAPTTWNFSHSLTLNAGDSVRWFTFKQGTGVTSFLTGSSIQLQVANLYYSQDIFYPLNAPDMKQIDFVTDVIKMHNCAIVPDRAIPNKVYIVPQNSYLGSGAVVDWTGKLDTSKDIVIGSTTDLQKGKFQFTYTAGEDIISKVYRNVDRIYGDYEAIGYTVNPDTLPSDFAIGDQKITLVTRSTPAGVVNGSNYIIPMFLNDSLQFVAPGPRCLFEAGTWPIQLYNESSSTTSLYSSPVLNNYSAVYAEIDDEDLNWAPEIPPHTIVANPYNNLFNKYWRTYMNALYSPEARMMEAHFALTLPDILTFSFADKIWIQDSYWRIIEITDYKVGMYESTKVKLLKFLEDVEDCTGMPISISLNGQVNFEDAGGDPVAASQDCCVRYGYTWDENLGVCWANVPTGSKPNSPTSGSTTNPAPRRTAVQTRNAQITDSVINGEDVTIVNGNKDMLAVGQRLELTTNVSGSNLLGKNVTTNLPGIHIGGGYKNGDITNTELGWAQSGVVILHRLQAITATGQDIVLDVEGITAKYINMPNDTLWSCIMNVTIRNAAMTVIVSEQYSMLLYKTGGVAGYAAPVLIASSGTFAGYTFTWDVDVVSNTNEHRIYFDVAGTTFPINIVATTSLQYQQSKTT